MHKLLSRRGIAPLNLLLLIVGGVTFYLACIFVPIYFNDFFLGKGITKLAFDGAGFSDTEVIKERAIKEIYKKFDMEIKEDAMDVYVKDDSLIMEVRYIKTVDIFLYGPVVLKFSHTAGSTIRNNDLK